MNTKDKNFYTVKELVALIGVGNISLGTIYHQINQGIIPVVYIGTRRLIPASWVEEKFFKWEGTVKE